MKFGDFKNNLKNDFLKVFPSSTTRVVWHYLYKSIYIDLYFANKTEELSNGYLANDMFKIGFRIDTKNGEFENIITSQYVDPKADKLKKIEELNHTINDLKRKQDSLYDDKFNNVISVETYQRLFNATEEDIKTAKDKLEQLQNEISSINDDSSCYVEYLDIIKSFLDMKNPTREIMNRIIDKIYVTKDKKLEIHYRIKKSEVLI